MNLTKLIGIIVGILFLSALSIYLINIQLETKIDLEAEDIIPITPILKQTTEAKEQTEIKKTITNIKIQDINFEKTQLKKGEKLKINFNVIDFAKNSNNLKYGISENIITKRNEIIIPQLTHFNVKELSFFQGPIPQEISIYNNIDIPQNTKPGTYTIVIEIIDMLSDEKTTYSQDITIV